VFRPPATVPNLTAGTLNINEKIELTSPKCPKARTWFIVSMISDKIKFGEDKSIIGKPRNKPRYTTLEKRPTAISLKGKPSTINNPMNINDVVTIIHQIILNSFVSKSAIYGRDFQNFVDA